ncbi:EAL domain-containing protein [Erythrobacter sp.]|uniref:EAL domain-containing protein n=1 Tax=Erythrobacter sp. TaxID=1042 RepID=UPI001B0C8860|nr:EAL domain-containing protein [Erythrobacter sp.]MBO6530210.1 EAL domain-containing protein [Erythrobacter sp.]
MPFDSYRPNCWLFRPLGVQDLKRRGVGIALDDFGTGHSSLTRLSDFPINKVKINGSLMQAIGRDRDAETIVHALIGMAANFGHGFIAEGIDTAEQKECLRRMGCLYGYCFLYGPAGDHSRFSLRKIARTTV